MREDAVRVGRELALREPVGEDREAVVDVGRLEGPRDERVVRGRAGLRPAVTERMRQAKVDGRPRARTGSSKGASSARTWEQLRTLYTSVRLAARYRSAVESTMDGFLPPSCDQRGRARDVSRARRRARRAEAAHLERDGRQSLGAGDGDLSSDLGRPGEDDCRARASGQISDAVLACP